MIGSLYGKLEERTEGCAILNVGNVGYRVFLSSHTFDSLPELGTNVKFFTYLYVRENALALYGFLASEELKMFEHLISISGIGPKGALSVLSIASPKDLRIAIFSGDDKLLTKVSGIGKKTAQKIILELKGKIEGIEGEGRGDATPESLRERQDAIDALHALGYSQHEAREALAQVADTVTSIEERVKEALRILGGKR